MLLVYVCIGGVVLALVGVAGVLGALSVSAGDALLYLITGVTFFYVGFRGWPPQEIRLIVGGIGALYAFSGGFATALLLAFDPPVETSDLVRLALGVLCVLGAGALRQKDDAPSTTDEEHLPYPKKRRWI